MGARRRKGSPGRVTRLIEPTIYKALIDRTRAGVPVPAAAESVGVPVRTVQDWIKRGLDEDERLAELVAAGDLNPTPDPSEALYLTFYRDVTAARADAAVRAVGNIQKVAMGGFVIEETTRKYRDEDGNLVEEKTVKRQQPDWRASAWYLERQHRAQFGKEAVQVEVSGQQTVEVTATPEAAAALAARVTEHIAAIQARQITAGDDVVEAEVE